jgi:hypothetical protein
MCEFCIDETVSGTRVDQSYEGIGDGGCNERKLEGVRVGKSGSVESGFHCTRESNAVLTECRGVRTAYSFFELWADVEFVELAALALAFDADDEGLVQSFAMWPTPPQNMQRWLSFRRCCSSLVSLPSLPNLSESGAEAEEVEVVVLLDFCFCLFP